MLTEHLTGQRQRPATEQELQARLEKRAQKKIRKQKASAKRATNIAAERAEMEKALHMDAMLQQIADTARNEALAARATEEEALKGGAAKHAMARA
jgi:hypothetical protein